MRTETIRQRIKFRRFGKRIVIALLAGKRLDRSLEVFFGQQRRHKAAAGRMADANALGRRAETLAQARGLRGRRAERPHHLIESERQQFAAACGRAEHTASRRDVPAATVMTW